MKNLRLIGVKGLKDTTGSGEFIVLFSFEPHITITGTMGKVVTLKIGDGALASDVADYLAKASNMLYEELKKG